MRKTISEVAQYIKSIVPPEPGETVVFKPVLKKIASPESFRDGIASCRDFLFQMYDSLIAEGKAYDTSKKTAHEYENRISLSVYYPFLDNLKNLLMKIGYHGAFADGHSLVCDNNIFDKRLSVAKSLECLRFLTTCGLCFDGVDLDKKKQNLSDIRTVTVRHLNAPAVMTGFKVMSMAEAELGTLANQDIFLRCDYRALQNGETDIVMVVRETIRPLPKEVQEFVLQLHERYSDSGVVCVIEIKGFHIYIKYCYKRKDVWGINASLNNGCHINVKAVKTQEYKDTIHTFPPFLQEMIAKGYGCGRKREIGRCDGGCRGLIIPLDDSVLDYRDYITKWFDTELSCLRRK